jgi:hypothetical protein
MINMKTYAGFPSYSKQHYMVSTLNPVSTFCLFFPNSRSIISKWKQENKGKLMLAKGGKKKKIATRTKRQSNGRIRAIPIEL